MAITDPTDLTGLVLWLDADDAATITEVANEVTQWDDKSTSGQDVTSSAGTRPAVGIVGDKDSVQFASADFMQNAALTGINPADFTIGYVVTPLVGANNDDMIEFADGGTTRLVFRQVGGGDDMRAFWNFAGSGDDITIDNVDSLPTNEISHHIVRRQPSGSGVTDLRSNDGTDNTNAGTTITSVVVDEITIGQRSGGGGQWTGHVHEIVVYNRRLTDLERTDLAAYFDLKWLDIGGGPTGSATLSSQLADVTPTGTVDPGASAGATVASQVAGVTATGTVASGATAGTSVASSEAGVAAAGAVDPGADAAASLPSQQAGVSPAGNIDPGASGSVTAASQQSNVTAAGSVGAAVTAGAVLSSAASQLSAAGVVDPGVVGSTSLASQQAGLVANGLAADSVIGSTSLPSQQAGIAVAGTIAASTNGGLTAALVEAGVLATGVIDPGATVSVALPSPQASVQVLGTVDPGASSSTSLPSQLAEVSVSGLLPLGPLGSAGGLVMNPAALIATGSVLNPTLGSAVLSLVEAELVASGIVQNPILGLASLASDAAGVSLAGAVDPGAVGSVSLASDIGSALVSGRTLDPGALDVRYFSEIIAEVRENVIYGSLDDDDREFERMTLKAEVHNLERTRGETFDFLLKLPDTASGSTFTMVANRQRDPSSGANNIFSISGVIDPVDTTEVTFTPVLADVDVEPGVYYFTIWQTTPLGAVRVAADGSLKINQGIPI